MVRTKTSYDIRILIRRVVDPAKGLNPLLLIQSKELFKDLRRRVGIVHCPMVMPVLDVQHLAHGIEVVGFVSRQQYPCHLHRIDRRERAGKIQIPCILSNEADIKLHVVTDQDTALTEVDELRQNPRDIFRAHDHLIGDGGQVRDAVGNRDPGIDELRKPGTLLSVLVTDRTDLNDPVAITRKAGGLDIEHHKAAALYVIVLR